MDSLAEKCGHGWLLPDFRDNGSSPFNAAVLDDRFSIPAIRKIAFDKPQPGMAASRSSRPGRSHEYVGAPGNRGRTRPEPRHYFLIGRRGPFRVRALVRVRWPRTGRPRRWRRPR